MKRPSMQIGLGIALGAGIGIAVGVALGTGGAWLAIGIAIGVAIAQDDVKADLDHSFDRVAQESLKLVLKSGVRSRNVGGARTCGKL